MRFRLLLIAVCFATIGCTPVVKNQDLESGPLKYVQDGQISREQLVLKLGVPANQIEGDRILTYRIAYNPDTREIRPIAPSFLRADPTLAQWFADFSLVLVFNASGMLERHSLVRAR